jgi:hypothetical protein
MAATLIVAKNTIYANDINCCCKTLVMAVTLIVLAKPFATALIQQHAATIFSLRKTIFAAT